jgi:hypothetical protein
MLSTIPEAIKCGVVQDRNVAFARLNQQSGRSSRKAVEQSSNKPLSATAMMAERRIINSLVKYFSLWLNAACRRQSPGQSSLQTDQYQRGAARHSATIPFSPVLESIYLFMDARSFNSSGLTSLP